MVGVSGVSSTCAAQGSSSGIDGGTGVTTASTFAAYPQEWHRTKLSSPYSQGARNSSDADPPIAPDCAETMT